MDTVRAQARATQTSRHLQRRNPTLTPASVHCITTMTRLVDGDQNDIGLLHLLNTIDPEISEQLMPEELWD